MPSVLSAVSNGETVVDRDSGGRGEWELNELEGAASDMTMVLLRHVVFSGSPTIRNMPEAN